MFYLICRMDPDEVILSQCASQLTQSPQYTDTKRFVYKCLVKSLSEIPSMKKVWKQVLRNYFISFLLFIVF